MGKRLITWWEARPARVQVQIAMPTSMLIIFVLHLMFFPNLSWLQSLLYAVMEGIPFALLVTFATQTELARRAHAEREAANRPGTSTSTSDELR